jgi:hypothetical protein
MSRLFANMGVGAFLAFLVVLIIFWPFVVIWAANTLFPALAIPYTFWTWLATLIFTATFGKANVSVKNK